MATNNAVAESGGFIENKGQWPSSVLYATDIPGGKLFIERSRLLYSFFESSHQHGNDAAKIPSTINAHAFELKFVNCNVSAVVRPQLISDAVFNYFTGEDASTWASDVHAYAMIELLDIYPGVNLKLYKSGSALKYDFVIMPGGRIADVILEYAGIDNIALKQHDLNIRTTLGEITELKPYAYQENDRNRREVGCRFRLDHQRVTFEVPGSWDRSKPLVIDPLIVFSAYSGSTADNWGNTATFDDKGNVYSAGIVAGYGYPAKIGAYQTSFAGGNWDIGIMKFDSAGTRLLYATYLGGRSSETPQSLLVNHAGELLILGSTSSTNFPVTNGSRFSGGTGFEPMDGVPYPNGSDIFIAKLNATGTRLLASTFIGGSRNDGVNFVSGDFDTRNMQESPLGKNYGDQFRGDIITDTYDNVYIASNTTSPDFTASLNNFFGGSHDAVVVKLNSDLSVLWSRYLGGNGTDAAYSLKLDAQSSIFIAGGTTSTNFSGINGYKKTKGSDIDGWIANVSSDGTSIINATYLGTGAYDQIYFLELNTAGEVYVYGQTQGNYPVSAGVFFQTGGGQFIQKLSNDLHSSLFSTVFGSGGQSPNISPTAFLVNDCNKIYIAGWGGALNTTVLTYRVGPEIVTITRNFVGGNTKGLKVSADAYQSSTTGNDFYLMVLDTDASSFLYGTFLGGQRSVTHVDGGTSRFDKRGIVYHAVCAGCGGVSDFPAIHAPAGHTRNQAMTGAQCNNAVFKFNLETLHAALLTNSVDLSTPGIDTLCFPSPILFENLSRGAKYYSWDFGDGTTETKNDTSSVIYTYKKPGIYLVTLTAYNSETCEGFEKASVLISVFDPKIHVVDDGTICSGNTYQLFADGGIAYSWKSDDGQFQSTIPNPVVQPEDSTLYYITVSSAVGCKLKDSVKVDVIPAASYQSEIIRQYDCWNRPTVRLIYSAKDSYDYTWMLGDENSSTEKDFTYHYETDGQYVITLMAVNQFCSYQQSTPVSVITVKIPNVITPGDENGVNDTMEIEASDPIDLFIYNRWGDLVFKEENYQNDWTGFGLDAGTYFYKAEIKNQTTCKGWVQIMK